MDSQRVTRMGVKVGWGAGSQGVNGMEIKSVFFGGGAGVNNLGGG